MHETAEKNSFFDIVIIGGGMVGASFACALQKALNKPSVKLLVVEAHPMPRGERDYQPSYDARSTALAYSSVEYYRQLGLWSELEEHAAAIDCICVSDKGKFGGVRMKASEMSVTALGYVVENANLGQVLNAGIKSCPAIEVWCPARVEKVKPLGQGVCLEISREDKAFSVTTNLVVVAEGGRSGLSEQLGIHKRVRPYQQSAIISNVSTEFSHDNRAYERFTRKGPLAMLPLTKMNGESRSALIWTFPADEAKTMMALDDAAFLSSLQADFGYRLGMLTRVGKRFSYPLSLIEAEEQYRPGIVLLGNVAHTLHPVAGQGLNLAVRDAMVLAEKVAAAVKRGENPGDVKVLKAYVEKREKDQHITVSCCDYLVRIFGSENVGLSWFRQFGLLGVDFLPPLKKTLVRHAMGLSQDMARISRL